MSLPPLVSDIVSIVVRGNFRPVDISPAWLRDQGLIGDPEYADGTFQTLIPNEVAIFTAGWIQCQASQESLSVQTDQQAEAERLRDLLAGILRATEGKPISALGINRNVHFTLSNVDAWHAIGDNVARNEIWKGVLDLPGMRSITYWGQRPDKYSGRIQVQIEPSMMFHPGIFVAYNDHYDLTIVDSQPKTRTEASILNRQENTEASLEKIPIAIDILSSQWETSFHRSGAIIERVSQQVGARR